MNVQGQADAQNEWQDDARMRDRDRRADAAAQELGVEFELFPKAE
jgi:hypothetical protein